MRDVFVSYSSDDRDRAKRLEAALESCDLTVWWDRELPVGESYDVKIERELGASKTVVVLWSPASVKSNWVKAEAQEAMGRGCLLPAILEAGTKPPLEFRFLNAVDLTNWDGTLEHPEFARLVKAIRAKVGAPEEEADPMLTTSVRRRLVEMLSGSEEGEGESAGAGADARGAKPITDSARHQLSEAARRLLGRATRKKSATAGKAPAPSSGAQSDGRSKGQPMAPRMAPARDPIAGVDPLPTLARYLGWSFAVPAALLVALQLAHRLLG